MEAIICFLTFWAAIPLTQVIQHQSTLIRPKTFRMNSPNWQTTAPVLVLDRFKFLDPSFFTIFYKFALKNWKLEQKTYTWPWQVWEVMFINTYVPFIIKIFSKTFSISVKDLVPVSVSLVETECPKQKPSNNLRVYFETPDNGHKEGTYSHLNKIFKIKAIILRKGKSHLNS